MERREEYARRELSVPVLIGGGVPQKTLPDEYRRKLDEKLDAHYAASGTVRPGSVEEDEALARIDELRAEEQRRGGKRGVPVFRKFENGEFVQYIDTRRSIRARSRLVRAT